ncbi:hypothetical protein M8A51_24455 [Schlegelella sp. S2-27]|uniref:DNA gyrase subunit B n=1 Tax=Caldimonas mangrovi TaxID=2944811 RepID=A0ABT0YWY4_9BURK|nr:hypothetical protein [Caldimonas mangrovi]MCM5682696.1 hypothetical protein [Caldimonas mangrovi]
MRSALLVAVTLAYPFAVYWGLGRFEPRWLALLLLGLALVRLGATRQRAWWLAVGVATLLAATTFFLNAALPLKLYPLLINGSMLALFTASLLKPPSAIERLARLRQPDLPPEGIVYTRRVTMVWCAFFVVNGLVSAWTAWFASDALWALYNGLVSYLMMGLLFAGEWLVRRCIVAKNSVRAGAA